MARRERRKFTDEYKPEVVALVRSSGKGIAAISRDLDLTETAVREWVQRADIDGGTRNGLSTAEREELTRLRRQVRVLTRDSQLCGTCGVSMWRTRRSMTLPPNSSRSPSRRMSGRTPHMSAMLLVPSAPCATRAVGAASRKFRKAPHSSPSTWANMIHLRSAMLISELTADASIGKIRFMPVW